jgi:hypothetical protein
MKKERHIILTLTDDDLIKKVMSLYAKTNTSHVEKGDGAVGKHHAHVPGNWSKA